MSIEDLKSNFSDFLRPNLYAVYIFPRVNFFEQGSNRIGMLAHEATFPFYTFTTNEFWYNNRRTSFANKVDYDPATFSFYVDRDNIILGFFDAWSKQIVNSNHQMGFYEDYIARIEVELFDGRMQTSAIATLVDAYPVNIESMQLGYAQNDAVTNLQVTFQFKEVEYEMIKSDAQSIVAMLQNAKSWKDFLTMGNLRRGVNMVSKIKNYRRMIENGNVYDVVTNARKIFTQGSKGGAGDRGIVASAKKIFAQGSKKSVSGYAAATKELASKASTIFKK